REFDLAHPGSGRSRNRPPGAAGHPRHRGSRAPLATGLLHRGRRPSRVCLRRGDLSLPDLHRGWGALSGRAAHAVGPDRAFVAQADPHDRCAMRTLLKLFLYVAVLVVPLLAASLWLDTHGEAVTGTVTGKREEIHARNEPTGGWSSRRFLEVEAPRLS